MIMNDETKIWNQFFMEYEFVRNYDIAYKLDQPNGLKPPALSKADDIIRTLFFMRLVSMLSEFLLCYIKQNTSDNPKKYDTLFKRINRLENDIGLDLKNDLTMIREKRNDIGHTRTVITRDEFDDAVKIITIVLKKLTFVSDKPTYRVYAKRESFKESDKPDVFGSFTYHYGVKNKTGKSSMIATWKISILEDSNKQVKSKEVDDVRPI